MDLKKLLKTKRPHLSDSSVTTYCSILKNLHNNAFHKDSMNMNDFNDSRAILGYLQEIPANRRKTILSALVVLTDNKAYRDAMIGDIKHYNTQIAKQVKTKAQKENWLDTDFLQKKLEEYKKNAELLYRKKTLTQIDLQAIQNYILLVMYSGEYIPPRRAKDFVDFRISEINQNEDNYLEKGELVFNSYKTASTYGQQRVQIPIKMRNRLKKWINVNPTKFLLFDKNQAPLTSVKLNQRLNKIFDNKKISVNALRHTFLTDKYADITNDLSDIGTSMNMATTYIKK